MELEKNDILLGLLDPFFWFLAPLFALLAVSACVILNYIAMSLVHGLAAICAAFNMLPNWRGNDRRRSGTAPFSTSSPRRRLLTTAVLLFFVGTLIPYQFAYMVACIVQLVTCIRGVRYARENVCRAVSHTTAFADSCIGLWRPFGSLGGLLQLRSLDTGCNAVDSPYKLAGTCCMAAQFSGALAYAILVSS
jgi:hypothetical protein